MRNVDVRMTYRLNDDGKTYSKFIESGQTIRKESLVDKKADLEEQLSERQVVASLTLAQIAFAAQVWQSYGKGIQDGIVTLAQAVENSGKALQLEIDAITEAIPDG